MRASARSGDSTVTWAGEVTESNGPAGKVLRGTFNQGPDVLERGHRIARIGEPLGAVFNPLIRNTLSLRFSRSASISALLTWGRSLEGTRNVFHKCALAVIMR
jgi:hypothetical protein